MKLNDPQRFARELQGDFSEIDRYLRWQRIEQAIIFIGILAVVAIAYFA